MKSIAILAATIVAAPSFAAEADWPEFRGSTGQGISAADRVPLTWSATENVAWKVAVPGKGWSSPVVAAGKIYLTAATTDSEPGASLHALCFDAKDGRLLWDREIFRTSAAATSDSLAAIDTIAPPEGSACINRPRAATSRHASSSENTPATHAADSSPML